MWFPTASRTTAFIAGASLAALAALLIALKRRGFIPYDPDSPELFPFLLVYFFVTVLIFAIDVRSIVPKELKTRIPGIYVPTDREGVRFLLAVWSRMALWFFGAATTGSALGLLERLLR